MNLELNIGAKLIAICLALAMAPLATISIFSYDQASNGMDDLAGSGEQALADEAFSKLDTSLAAKKIQIEEYFNQREIDTLTLAETHAVERYFTARAGDDAVGNAMGQDELENGVDGWRQTVQNYINERGADMDTMSNVDVIQNYFAADNGDLASAIESSQEQLGYMSKQLWKNLEIMNAQGLTADQVEAIIAGTVGAGLDDDHGNMTEIFRPGYIGKTGYFYFTDLDSNIIIHHSLAEGNNLIDDSGLTVFTSIKADINSNVDIRSGEDYGVAEYLWEDTTQDGSPLEKKFISYTYFEPYDWIICPSVYYYELMDAAKESINSQIVNTFVQFQVSKMIDVHGEIIDIYDQVILTDATGQEITRTEVGEDITDTNNDWSTEKWYVSAAALDEGEFVFNDIGAELMTSGEIEDVLHISSPVYFNGELAGVIDLKSHYFIVSMLIDPVVYGDTGYLYIINEDGVLVSHPKYSIADDEDISESRYGALADIVKDSMLEGDTGFDRYIYEGVDKYVAYAPIMVGDDTFSIAATMPVSELNALADTEAYNGIITAFGSYQLGKTFEHDGTTMPMFHEILLTDEEGNELALVDGGEDVTDKTESHADETWFDEVVALQEGEITVSDLYEETIQGQKTFMMFIRTPIYYDGAPVGTLNIDLRTEPINAVMTDDTGMGESGETYLVGPDKMMRSTSRFSTTSTIMNSGYLIDTPSTSAALAGESDHAIIKDYRNVDVLSCYAPLPLFQGDLQWVIIAEQDESESFAASQEMAGAGKDSTSSLLSTMVIMGIIAAVVAAGIALVFSRKMAAPIQRLENDANIIAGGDFDHELTHVESTDEIGQLASAFGKMIDNTKQTMADANQKVDNLNNMPTPVMTVDKDFNITYINPAGAGVGGKKPEEVMGMKCFDLFKTHHCNTSECRVGQAMNKNGTFTGETMANPDPDTAIPIQYTGAPIKNETGDVIGALEFVVDITEAKDLMQKQKDNQEYMETMVTELVGVIDKAANGDLTVSAVKLKDDDIGRLADGLNTMIGNLTELVLEIQSTSENVASTSQELASSAEEMNASTEEVSSALQQISQGTANQAQQVESTAEVMRTMAETVDQVTSQAAEAADVAKNSSDSATSGREAVDNAIAKMRSIQTVVNESAKSIDNLGKRSEEIGQIVEVITGITEQTNLLALNAAIEAARAGEQGRGFAVVAEEVKNLAEDSRQAAGRIATMIKDIQDETGNAVSVMETGTKEVAEGLKAVELTGELFSEIAQMAQNTSAGVQSISAATQQQKAGTEQVATSVDGIATVAEESASAAEESSASTEELTSSMQEMTARASELSEMAVNLQHNAEKFRVEGGKKKRAHRTSKPVPVPVPAPSAASRGFTAPMPDKVVAALGKRGIDVKTEANDVTGNRS